MPAATGEEATMIESRVVAGIEEALRRCGVTERTLTAAEKDAIDQQGYLVLPGALGQNRLGQLRTAFDLALDQGRRSGIGCELDCYDPVFDGISTSRGTACPRLLPRPTSPSDFRLLCAISWVPELR